ncbi:MAG: cation-translocating P-type ATPase [Bacillota bacterium]
MGSKHHSHQHHRGDCSCAHDHHDEVCSCGHDHAETKLAGRGVSNGIDQYQVITDDVLAIEGMDCADCATRLERAVARLPGVARAAVTFATGKMKVSYDPTLAGPETIIGQIEGMGYRVAEPPGLSQAETIDERPVWRRTPRLPLTALSGLLLLGGIIASRVVPGPTAIALYGLAILAGGYYPARSGLYSLRTGFSFDMNVLMTVAVIGAVFIGEWVEGATVIFLFSVGHALESLAMDRTRQSIRGLIQLAPKEATVRRSGHEIRVPLAEIQVGEVVLVRPGERIAVDGKVLAGTSAVNQAPITGESIPVDKGPGDDVYAGTVNQQGFLEIRTTRRVDDTTLAKIVRLVEEAQAQKAPSQRFVDIFARRYTPAVITLALGLAVIPPLVWQAPLAPWLYRALSLLVVSCPCALVISTPVSIVSAIGNAARHGILIKGGVHLEEAGRVRVVAFDKTGTLTAGQPEVTQVIPLNGLSSDELLRLATAVEYRSEHPLAEAVVREAQKRRLEFVPGEHFVAIAGKAAKARVDGRNYYAGSPRFFTEELGLELPQGNSVQQLQMAGNTAILVGCKSEILGVIGLADRVRESSRLAVERLHQQGVRTVMLTGDHRVTAQAVAAELGIQEYRAELLPEGKVEAIRDLVDKYGKVAMVGDGINDAPALARATVGIAMGGAGTDAALETADIALMADDLAMLPYAMELSRRALGVIHQNIGFALVVKILAVAAIFPGWLNLWLAILADTGAALIVILNGMRLLRGRGADGTVAQDGKEVVAVRIARG